MDREEAKELLPIIQAFAEGKTIQYCYNKDGIQQWVDVPSDETVNFSDYTSKYRIKPESKYRPFKNEEECWQEALKHKPFGWVKWDGILYNMSAISPKSAYIVTANYGQICFEYAYQEMTFADGTPFGVKVE